MGGWGGGWQGWHAKSEGWHRYPPLCLPVPTYHLGCHCPPDAAAAATSNATAHGLTITMLIQLLLLLLLLLLTMMLMTMMIVLMMVVAMMILMLMMMPPPTCHLGHEPAAPQLGVLAVRRQHHVEGAQIAVQDAQGVKVRHAGCDLVRGTRIAHEVDRCDRCQV